ncbi:hypothetical protein PENTCL1PPCAC_28250 [Pristionchus entomophagus]|uniref:UPAR/Ly6 domain-containing protein n=1 Tax=Pristionchus entomophagus TaxID=358040 RepID=A0AAV5UGD3_9BILA|nr:hypothetical protein PENTCL1PPCAC_21414 [Pristionchus entomophagus]GMT06076.1 hypothetical protein PENTCL1PPCAC_28250 [Pristionchus entomophagus]
MLLKVYLTLLLAAGVFSLECVFEVQAGATRLDVEGGIDKCESSDQYCAMLNYNGIYAKGCSKTAEKITGVGMPAHISCTEEKCNEDESLCCCKGDRCNSTVGASMMSVMSLIVTGLIVKN